MKKYTLEVHEDSSPAKQRAPRRYQNRKSHPKGKPQKNSKSHEKKQTKITKKQGKKTCGYCCLHGHSRDECPIRALRQHPDFIKCKSPSGKGQDGSLSRKQHIALFKSGLVQTILTKEAAAAKLPMAGKAKEHTNTIVSASALPVREAVTSTNQPLYLGPSLPAPATTWTIEGSHCNENK